MATGVEVKVPFLDTNLVKFVQSIPSALKMKNSTPKFILKNNGKKVFQKNAHKVNWFWSTTVLDQK